MLAIKSVKPILIPQAVPGALPLQIFLIMNRYNIQASSSLFLRQNIPVHRVKHVRLMVVDPFLHRFGLAADGPSQTEADAIGLPKAVEITG